VSGAAQWRELAASLNGLLSEEVVVIDSNRPIYVSFSLIACFHLKSIYICIVPCVCVGSVVTVDLAAVIVTR
jgi:hypothetical protein